MQQIPRWVQVLLIALFFILVAIWADLNFNWTGYGFVNGPLTQGQAVDRHKTIWDWMDLLIIPAVLASGVFYINQAERRNESNVARERIEEERKIAAERVEDAALETYLKQMSELLIDQGLRETEETDEKRTVARAWTLTIARRLGSERKGTLLQFLYEAGLINKDHPIISLKGANLVGANLQLADLHLAFLVGANLEEANLVGVNLVGANLEGVNLEGANLEGVNLEGAYLEETKLSYVNLSLANLRFTKLQGAYLEGVNLRLAFLKEANLVGAHLRFTDLQGADLQGADLQGADLRLADLRLADLQGAYLVGAIYDKNTKWSKDFDPANNGAVLAEEDE